jgi:large subunit ribosomal protein L1
MKRGKKYLEKIKQREAEKQYAPSEAVKLLKNLAYANFDESIEVHFNLGIDTRQADQQIRGTVSLPHGTGKKIKIAAITTADKVVEAKAAGADEAGAEDLIDKIAKGWFDFDLALASSEMMPKVGKLGKLLGQKGLMPSPKNGTVTPNIVQSIKEFKKGKVEYRNDKAGLVHLVIGKKSFSEQQLLDNFNVVYDVILKVKPSNVKGIYLKSVVLCSTMSPGVRIETS